MCRTKMCKGAAIDDERAGVSPASGEEELEESGRLPDSADCLRLAPVGEQRAPKGEAGVCEPPGAEGRRCLARVLRPAPRIERRQPWRPRSGGQSTRAGEPPGPDTSGDHPAGRRTGRSDRCRRAHGPPHRLQCQGAAQIEPEGFYRCGRKTSPQALYEQDESLELLLPISIGRIAISGSASMFAESLRIAYVREGPDSSRLPRRHLDAARKSAGVR